jgi:hypothetical protein
MLVQLLDIHLAAISDAIALASCPADDFEVSARLVLVTLARREVLRQKVPSPFMSLTIGFEQMHSLGDGTLPPAP